MTKRASHELLSSITVELATKKARIADNPPEDPGPAVTALSVLWGAHEFNVVNKYNQLGPLVMHTYHEVKAAAKVLGKSGESIARMVQLTDIHRERLYQHDLAARHAIVKAYFTSLPAIDKDYFIMFYRTLAMKCDPPTGVYSGHIELFDKAISRCPSFRALNDEIRTMFKLIGLTFGDISYKGESDYSDCDDYEDIYAVDHFADILTWSTYPHLHRYQESQQFVFELFPPVWGQHFIQTIWTPWKLF